MRARFRRKLFANCCSPFTYSNLYPTNEGLLKIKHISRVKKNNHINYRTNNKKC